MPRWFQHTVFDVITYFILINTLFEFRFPAAKQWSVFVTVSGRSELNSGVTVELLILTRVALQAFDSSSILSMQTDRKQISYVW